MLEFGFSIFKFEISLGHIHIHKYPKPEAPPVEPAKIVNPAPQPTPHQTVRPAIQKAAEPAVEQGSMTIVQSHGGRVSRNHTVPPEFRHIVGSVSGLSQFDNIAPPKGSLSMTLNTDEGPIVYLRENDPYPHKLIQVGTRKWSDGRIEPIMAQVRRKAG